MSNKPWDSKREALRELLKELRQEKAMTQAELSAIQEKPQSYVSKYENGERKLDFVEIAEICKALDISMQEFSALYDERITK